MKDKWFRKTFKCANFLLMLMLSLTACTRPGGYPQGTDWKFGEKESSEIYYDDPEVVTGGKIDNTNENAPKEIVSTTLTSFSCSFYRDGYDLKRDNGFYELSAIVNMDGSVTITAMITGEEAAVTLPDTVFMEELQKIIEEEQLALKNGVYRYTAGLPEEFTPSMVDAVYESGETISFYEEGDPEASWTGKLIILMLSYLNR